MFLHKDINSKRKISYINSMKNISLFCLLFCLTILACDKEKSGTPKSGNGYYMFSITIDGVTHKVEGNYSSPADMAMGNFCNSTVTSSGIAISAQLADKAVTSYVSGEVFSANLGLSNSSLGSNNAGGGISNTAAALNGLSGPITAPNNLNWPETIGCPPSTSPVFAQGNVFTSALSSTGIGSTMWGLDNVMITNLGTGGTYNLGNISNPYTFGDPVIGSFSGTVYGCSTSTSGYDIPVQLEIEFVAPRFN
tara:strand:- start:138 stop:890 length:753 start_codon:yes stop_codon:yes gene_type:complete